MSGKRKWRHRQNNDGKADRSNHVKYHFYHAAEYLGLTKHASLRLK
jgi:hypothetical protein